MTPPRSQLPGPHSIPSPWSKTNPNTTPRIPPISHPTPLSLTPPCSSISEVALIPPSLFFISSFLPFLFLWSVFTRAKLIFPPTPISSCGGFLSSLTYSHFFLWCSHCYSPQTITIFTSLPASSPAQYISYALSKLYWQPSIFGKKGWYESYCHVCDVLSQNTLYK